MIHALITVRTNSSRLPNKCLLPFGDSTVLHHIIKRVKFYSLIPIVCTTIDDSDDIIESIALENDVKIFRGSVHNKLKRWADCCAEFFIESFHTIDADDPFFDGDEVRRSFSLLYSEDLDMVAPTKRSFNGGASVGYSLTRSIVDKTLLSVADDQDTEMMWSWIESNAELRMKTLTEIKGDIFNMRLTLDYEEDYWLLSTVLRIVGPLAPRSDVDKLFLNNPDLYKINWFRSAEWAENQAKKLK